MIENINIGNPNSDELRHIGKLVANNIKKMMDINSRHQSPAVYTELITFENRENGKNEWVQVNLSLNFNPLYFCKPAACFTSYIPARLGKDITEEKIACMQKVAKILMENSIDGKLVDKVLDIMEETIYTEMNILTSTTDK